MGFFKALGRGLGNVISWVGKKTGIEVIEKAGKALHKACEETSERISNEDSYDSNSSSTNDTERVLDILSDFVHNTKDQAKEIENQVKEAIQEYSDTLHDYLGEKTEFRSILKGLRRNRNRMLSEVDGIFLGVISRRASLADNECEEILKMPSGPKKKKRTQEFTADIIGEALDAICDNVEEITNEISQDIETTLGDLVLRDKNRLQDAVEKLNEMIAADQDSEEEREKVILPTAQKLAAAEIALAVLREAQKL